MPFLTFYTPTYKRPKLLADCIASVQAQSDQDYEHLIIPDFVGIGIAGVFGAVPEHTDDIMGKYVYFLQDDDVIVDEDFVKGLKEFTLFCNYPPVIIARNIKGRMNLPTLWRSEPIKGTIDLGSYIIRADIFKMHADKFGHRYEGDYDFIHHLWDVGLQFEWWDNLIARAQQWGFGMPEKNEVVA